jgi:3-hydroxyisobutyrate dehydrogenase
MQKIQTIGLIGVGLMGEPITLRLLAAGYSVNVWNRSTEKLTTVLAAGAKAPASLDQLIQDSDIVMLCLADSTVVEKITKQHILAYGNEDKLLIDLSSTHPDVTQKLAKLLKKTCNMGWVDAPVSGGVTGAKTGSLAIMAGGTKAHIAIAKKVLNPLYSQLTHMGKVGSGQITKICNQMIVSCHVLVIAEALALAKKSGVDVKQIAPALAGGFADSKPLQIVAPQMAENCFTPIKWRVKTLLKDLNMATDIANQQNTSTPMSALASQLMQLHGSKGFLDQDPATLIKLYDDRKK